MWIEITARTQNDNRPKPSVICNVCSGGNSDSEAGKIALQHEFEF